MELHCNGETNIYYLQGKNIKVWSIMRKCILLAGFYQNSRVTVEVMCK